MNISILPSDSLVHENVLILVDNLKPQTLYKLELHLLHDVGTFRSFAVFKSNIIGNIDLSRDAPIRGTYSGIRSMGLFESVEPTENVRYGAYCNCTPPENFNYLLILKDSKNEKILSKKCVKRLKHPFVERIEVEKSIQENIENQYKITGTLFKPPGNGPFPTIIDISGTGGGINEQKSAALASRGFVAFSLAFFQYKNLPDNLNDVDVEYFERAAKYLISLPYTDDKIGFQGVSFGGMLALYLATKFPQYIRAVVSINGNYSFDDVNFIKEHGKTVAHGILNKDENNLKFVNELLCFKAMCENMELPEEAIFQYNNSNPNCSFRFVSALDDLSAPNVSATNFHAKHLRKLKRYVDVHFVPGGHLLDPPCYPSHPIVFSKYAGTFQAYGGEASLHGKSEFEVWEKTIEFFAKFLGTPKPLPKYSTESKI